MKKIILFIFISFQLFSQKPLNFQWLSHPSSIQSLDSLIQHSTRMGLNNSDYPHRLLQLAHKINTQSDSIQVEKQIQQVASRFFKHLAYGNRVPHFDFNGIPNQLFNYQIDRQITFHITQNSLGELAQNLLTSTKEVDILHQSLNKLMDSTPHQTKKIALLKKALNEYRWLSALKKKYSKFILVNIPSTQLRTYTFGKEELRMKVIVGRAKRPTRTLVSKIDQIICNPYWHLPKKISVEEYLPKIQKDIHYLEKNHFQVLDQNYQSVDPQKVNWNHLNTRNFPYRLRENPSEKSTLGFLKFEFYSPFLIYLHDTSDRYVFQTKHFFRSHGCVRVEKPFELARYILSDLPNISDEISQEKLQLKTKPKNIKTSKITPIVIWYSLVDFDADGKVKFYKDAYLGKR
ncbi:L,D-transpeptidase family protein [Aquirufa sp. ROCK2-A2]